MQEGLTIKVHMNGVDEDVVIANVVLVNENGTKMTFDAEDNSSAKLLPGGNIVYQIEGLIDFLNEDDNYEDIIEEEFDELISLNVESIHFMYEVDRPLGALCEKVELSLGSMKATIIDLEPTITFGKFQ